MYLSFSAVTKRVQGFLGYLDLTQYQTFLEYRQTGNQARCRTFGDMQIILQYLRHAQYGQVGRYYRDHGKRAPF